MEWEPILKWMSNKLDWSGLSQADLHELDELLGEADQVLSVEEQRDASFEALQSEDSLNMRALRDALKHRIAEKRRAGQ